MFILFINKLMNLTMPLISEFQLQDSILHCYSSYSFIMCIVIGRARRLIFNLFITTKYQHFTMTGHMQSFSVSRWAFLLPISLPVQTDLWVTGFITLTRSGTLCSAVLALGAFSPLPSLVLSNHADGDFLQLLLSPVPLLPEARLDMGMQWLATGHFLHPQSWLRANQGLLHSH